MSFVVESDLRAGVKACLTEKYIDSKPFVAHDLFIVSEYLVREIRLETAGDSAPGPSGETLARRINQVQGYALVCASFVFFRVCLEALGSRLPIRQTKHVLHATEGLYVYGSELDKS